MTGHKITELSWVEALASVAHLGHGADGPWENRGHIVRDARLAGRIGYPVTDAWVNATYSVQLLQHHGVPAGLDHLIVRRHDEGVEIPWSDLQRIKDRLPDGQFRWAYEAFPPTLAIVDNCNLRHIWVLAIGERMPVDLREVKT